MTIAASTGKPAIIAIIAPKAAVTITCATPSTYIFIPRTFNLSSGSSKPIVNSKKTTPNSAIALTVPMSLTSPRLYGPTTAPAINWPDDNGPEIPNNATFTFDFTVKKDRIAEGAQIFFNLVYADYDVNPATIRVEFANGKVQNLALENTASFGFDGLIEARIAFFSFTDVFSPDAEGNWKGFARVIFLAPFEPWTAFDFVEMSLVGLS